MSIKLTEAMQQEFRQLCHTRDHFAIVMAENGTVWLETGTMKELVKLQSSCDTKIYNMSSVDIFVRPAQSE